MTDDNDTFISNILAAYDEDGKINCVYISEILAKCGITKPFGLFAHDKLLEYADTALVFAFVQREMRYKSTTDDTELSQSFADFQLIDAADAKKLLQQIAPHMTDEELLQMVKQFGTNFYIAR